MAGCIVCCWILFSPSAIAATPDYSLDRNALVALYDSTGGETWLNNSGWLSLAEHCDWYGVNCSQSVDIGQVIELQLKSNGLTGTVAEQVAALTRLQGFYVPLDNNSLSGMLRDSLRFVVCPEQHCRARNLCEHYLWHPLRSDKLSAFTALRYLAAGGWRCRTTQ